MLQYIAISSKLYRIKYDSRNCSFSDCKSVFNKWSLILTFFISSSASDVNDPNTATIIPEINKPTPRTSRTKRTHTQHFDLSFAMTKSWLNCIFVRQLLHVQLFNILKRRIVNNIPLRESCAYAKKYQIINIYIYIYYLACRDTSLHNLRNYSRSGRHLTIFSINHDLIYKHWMNFKTFILMIPFVSNIMRG